MVYPHILGSKKGSCSPPGPSLGQDLARQSAGAVRETLNGQSAESNSYWDIRNYIYTIHIHIYIYTIHIYIYTIYKYNIYII